MEEDDSFPGVKVSERKEQAVNSERTWFHLCMSGTQQSVLVTFLVMMKYKDSLRDTEFFSSLTQQPTSMTPAFSSHHEVSV